MKLTLLQVINYYMDHSDGFRISTIDDGLEAQQVASIAEKVFYDLDNDVFGNRQLESLVQLESLADSEKPNYLKLPTNASDIRHDVVMYNTSQSNSEVLMNEMVYITPLEFLEKVGNRIATNKAPEYYTSFDDEFLVFDSYDKIADDTLQASKSGVITQIDRSFTQSDSYIIDFPEWFHPTYLNSVMAEASAALREEPLPSIARLARLGIIKARKKNRIGQRITSKNYGRY